MISKIPNDLWEKNDSSILDPCCGNGNFSIALAPNFEKVLATEIAKSSVTSAQVNIAANNIIMEQLRT